MFWFLMVLLFVVFGAACYLRANYGITSNGNDWRGFGSFLFFVAGIFLVVTITKSLVGHSDQIEDNEKLVQITQVRDVLKNRAETLTREFADCLVEKYPQHEKSIFKEIKPENIGIYVVKFPEIQSAKTIMEYVNQVKALKDAYYEKDIARADILKDMRYRAKTPWILQWIMPNIKIPEQ